jgi:hypothetical protein
MRIRKTLITALALAIAIAFSPLPELQAATLLGPSSQPGTDNITDTVKMKKKAKKKAKAKKGKKKKKKGKKARSKAGKCGTYMYYSKKTRKCMDARNKK